jgi:hypothetical protein
MHDEQKSQLLELARQSTSPLGGRGNGSACCSSQMACAAVQNQKKFVATADTIEDGQADFEQSPDPAEFEPNPKNVLVTMIVEQERVRDEANFARRCCIVRGLDSINASGSGKVQEENIRRWLQKHGEISAVTMTCDSSSSPTWAMATFTASAGAQALFLDASSKKFSVPTTFAADAESANGANSNANADPLVSQGSLLIDKIGDDETAALVQGYSVEIESIADVASALDQDVSFAKAFDNCRELDFEAPTKNAPDLDKSLVSPTPSEPLPSQQTSRGDQAISELEGAFSRSFLASHATGLLDELHQVS